MSARIHCLQQHLLPAEQVETNNTMSGGRSPLTTHILDTALGKPAANVPVEVSVLSKSGHWTCLSSGKTNEDGRCPGLVTQEEFQSGTYKIRFDTKYYYETVCKTKGFYPYVEIVFVIEDPGEHYHVPLLLSPYGYSTYRGS